MSDLSPPEIIDVPPSRITQMPETGRVEKQHAAGTVEPTVSELVQEQIVCCGEQDRQAEQKIWLQFISPFLVRCFNYNR